MTTSPRKPQVNLALSREELYVVMRTLKASTLPGFDLSWLQRSPEGNVSEETEQALQIATRALLARGFLIVRDGEGQPMLAEEVAALVGACTFSQESLLLLIETGGKVGTVFIHHIPQLTVMQTLALPAIHQFTVLWDQQDLLETVDRLLDLHDQGEAEPALPPGSVAAALALQARTALRVQRLDEAIALLERGGLSPALARALAEATKDGNNVLISITSVKDEQPVSLSLAVIVTPQACFSLQQPDSAFEKLMVRQTSAQALRDWLLSSLSYISQQKTS